jgi:N-acetylglucosaminyl-diphospho-decaprenol L-rhamnosyltransferase
MTMQTTPHQFDISVLIVNYNTAHLLQPMFDALDAAKSDLALQPILVDNASRDNSVEYIKSNYPDLQLITNKTNVGFGRANNQCLPLIRGRFVLLLNTDAFVAPDSLIASMEFMRSHPQVGVLGVKLIGRDGALQPSCRFFPTPINSFLQRTGLHKLAPTVRLVDDMSWDHDGQRYCDWVPGCYYLIRREVVDTVGLFDPRFFLYCEEVDHCKRVIESGWKVAYLGSTTVVHIGGESAASDGALTKGRQISTLQTESEFLYFRKHHGIFGAVLHLLLSITADSMSLIKGAVKLRKNQFLEAARNINQTASIARSTRMGSRNIR